jgi:predicted ATPase with chaperone activity
MVEQILLKSLYFQGDTLGRDLAISLGLKFSVIEGIIELLKHQHLIQVKKSLGMGNISAIYSLTETGRTVAREHLNHSQYAGRVPVPLDQYEDMVAAQKLPDSWLTMEMLRRAFKHMVVSEDILSRVGPAVNAGKSFLIYGQPGNGKTYLAEALFGLDPSPIYIPHAIEAQGMVIELFDPLHHQPIETPEEAGSLLALARQPTYDMRWTKVRRPFIVSGGELDKGMLELNYNEAAKFYSAPMQLKANNGIYLIDDFGRQKASPAEVLNRWIVPMERRVDYLTFKNGTKMNVPFECFLIFSSNLQPTQLGDEAFLRRIQYKMLLKSPEEGEFKEIFDRFCDQQKLPCEQDVFDRFLQKHYRNTGKRRRRCHPRDVISHAMDLIRFEKRMWKLTDEVLDHAFESCFTEVGHDA